jgi:hypothetical protein
MTSAPLMPLAYYLCKHGCEDIYQSVEDLELPSNLHLNADRMEYLQEQFDELAQLGLATDGHLTPLGTNMEQWIGQADLAYSVQLQRRFNEGARFPEVMFWVVATALSTTPISALRARYSYFVDYEGQHSELPHAVDLFSGVDHEDLASFSVMCWLGDLMPWLLWPINSGTRPVEEEDLFELAKFCNVNGLDSRKLRQAAKAIANTWKLFSRVNRDSERFRTSFNSKLEMSGVYWRRLRDDIPVAQLATALRSLPGQTSVRLSYNEAINAFEWYDDKHGHQGTISQDDSPIRLTDGVELLVRIIPSREGKGADTTWRLAHIGVAPVRVIPPPPPPVRTFYPRQAPASYPPTPPVPVGYYPVPPTNTAPEQNFIHPHPAPSWWDRVKKWFSE